MPITFGRFSDSFKPKEKVEFWNTSERLFQEKKYVESYEAFFNYLKDDTVNNVTYTRQGNDIDFRMLQGSKLISGHISDGRVEASSDVATYEKLSVAFMRRLMEMNYTLFYTRFALKDNLICIKFDSSIPASPPRKLYYAWKELATRADKQDDLLTGDFPMLRSAGSGAVEEIPEAEKEVKYNFYRGWLENTIKRVSELNEDAFAGGISYLLLNTAYKIDYLISPEGGVMNDLEKMSWEYFAKDNKPFVEKNRKMKESLKKLLEIPKEKVTGDMYRVKSTFGIANPAPHQTIVDLFNNNIQNVKWYIDNNYNDIAVTIYEYLATYSLFSYGLPKPDLHLFHLLLNVTNQDFFNSLGAGEKYYDIASGMFRDQLIKEKVNAIIKDNQVQYPDLKFNTENLKFDSMLSFLRTLIAETQQLNYNS